MDRRQFCHERKVAANIRPCTTNQFITFNGIVIIVNGLNHWYLNCCLLPLTLDLCSGPSGRSRREEEYICPSDSRWEAQGGQWSIGPCSQRAQPPRGDQHGHTPFSCSTRPYVHWMFGLYRCVCCAPTFPLVEWQSRSWHQNNFVVNFMWPFSRSFHPKYLALNFRHHVSRRPLAHGCSRLTQTLEFSPICFSWE